MQVSFFRRREQKRPAAFVRKDSRSQPDLHGCAFFALLRKKMRDAQFAAFTKLRYGTEQALRRFWRAKSGAEFHHRLVPIPGRFGLKISIRAFLQLLPARRFAQISANGSQARQNASNVAVQHGLFLAESNAENGCRGVIPDSRQR